MSGALYFPEMMGGGVALLDYDGDGDLDVYLVQGQMLGDKPVSEATFAPRYPLPLTDRLYRNDLEDGVLSFTDVTRDSGLRAEGYGMGVAAADYDNDGDVDLYVTNYGSNQLWRNVGDGKFEEVTGQAGVDDDRWSVSAAWVDYDRDGWLDLYVGNYVDYSFT
ncbi:MAG: VCBS repeat-containing protein, partial [Chromatiales bacterium]|nr:VCBS repeat-containing protein [Chromatiales bacterium]